MRRQALQYADRCRADGSTRVPRERPQVTPAHFPRSQALGNQGMQRLLHAGAIQPKLRISQPGDPYEHEADRVAEQVMRMPLPSGTCAACADGDESCPRCAASARGRIQRRALPHARDATTTGDHPRIGPGRALDTATRAWFEPRFGVDFSNVRLHTGAHAAASARAFGAYAYTLGQDIVFGAGQYAPGSDRGRRLLAHELTHVVQQRAHAPRRTHTGVGVRTSLAPETVAGDWIIDNPTHRHSSGGDTDASLIGTAFNTICSLAGENHGRIQIGQGPPTSSNIEGCACLWDIENDLASPSPVLNGMPHIRLDEHGWSHTNPAASPPFVAARHPESEFEWGYWTGGQTRHVKPFWQTVAHEVCGHVAAFVRSHGSTAGGRTSRTGHNEAIEGENRIAAEHGVPVSEQRGLDRDPRTGAPLRGHRGESFLEAVVGDFAHGSDSPPASTAAVVRETLASIRTGQSTVGLDLFIQVEGRAYANEGGAGLARRRAANVRARIAAAMSAAGIAPDVTSGSSTVPRFRPDIATVIPGRSRAGASDRNRRVQVYLFHKLHSAGP